MLKRILRHLRNGTLLERVQFRLGRMPEYVRVHWLGADTPEQAVRALTRCAQLFRGDDRDGWIMSLGDGDAFHQLLNRKLAKRKVVFRAHTLADLATWDKQRAQGLKGIVCGYTQPREITQAARTLAKHPLLAQVPFEYAAGLNVEREIFRRRDEYAQTHFVAPSLLDHPSPYELYEESLQRFEQKCGLRDYLDLFQMLRYVVENKIPGDIAEFGSYKGHSGWLIAKTLLALGSDKRVFLFDMFDEFPRESFGVDYFWNDSHHVNALEVVAKLRELPNVNLVRGDFTQTLATSGVQQLSLAYVDCDSYRATRFLIDALWENHLAPRGVLICEDYGHPALLGNRAAVHEELDGRPGLFRYFSQFSGYYIVMKLP